MQNSTDPAPITCRSAGRTTAGSCSTSATSPRPSCSPRPGTPGPTRCTRCGCGCARGCGLAQLADDTVVPEEVLGREPAALTEQRRAAIAAVAAAGVLPPGGGTAMEFPSPHGGTWLDGLAAPRVRRGAARAAGRRRRRRVLRADARGRPAGRAAHAGRRGGAGRHAGPDVPLPRRDHGRRPVERAAAGPLRLLLDAGHGRHARRAGHDRHLRAPVPAVRRHGGAHGLARRRADTRALCPSCSPPNGPRGSLDADAVGALGEAVGRTVTALRARLEEHRAAGRRVYGYAAASRAVSLLCLVGADRTLLAGVADASPAKLGRRMPGTDVPVIAPEELVAAEPDVVLVFVSDVLDEVRRALPQIPADRWVDAGPDPPSPRPARCAPARWSACARRSAAPSPAARAAGPGAASPAAAARSPPARPPRSAR